MLPRVERSKKALAATGLVASLVTGLALTMGGCGQSVSSYCYDAKQCEGGNDYDEQACNLNYQRIQDLAEVQNCGAELNDYFDCLTEQSQCNNDDHYTTDDRCKEQYDQLDHCADLEGEVY